MSTKPTHVTVFAPLSGRVVPIETVPDPVFSQKMVGDGLSIEPSSELVHSPIDGRVVEFHAARHSVVIEHVSGVKVMVHVGIDTVMLAGEGFRALVGNGDDVYAGQPLLLFDARRVAASAASLLTQVVVLDDERVASIDKISGTVEAGTHVLMTLQLGSAGTTAVAPEPDGAWLHSPCVEIPNPAGLHSRPAAVLARHARRYAARIVLSCGELQADAKSVVEILGLATRRGDRVRLSVCGADAPLACDQLEQLLRDGCGERLDAPAVAAVREVVHDRAGPVERDLPQPVVDAFAGIAAAPGLAVGHIVRWHGTHLQFDAAGGTYEEERGRLFEAMQGAAEQLEALAFADEDAMNSGADIMDAHLALLDDPALLDTAVGHLREGASAPSAWQRAYESVAARLAGHPSPFLRERAVDIRDVGLRVMSQLRGVRRTMPQLSQRSIVVADDLTPSETISFDRNCIVGLCTAAGGPTSHVAILARSMGIPAICGIDPRALSLSDGVLAVIDGGTGMLRADPDPVLLDDVERRIKVAAAVDQVRAQTAHRPGGTRDGHRVEVVANVCDAHEAVRALAAGAEGVGLLRSEFLFEDREAAPDEDEQCTAYGAVLAALGPQRKCIVRTLDVGGDKPLRYLPLPKETNPFLGLRGIRVGLANPDLLRSQLRAMLRAAPSGDLHIMLPMVSDLDEVMAVKRILREEQETHPHPVKLGVMVEVPSAVALVGPLAREVDFLSIGTNDLAQYTLAMDRGHATLSSRIDALHPGVLRMIELTVSGAHAQGKWVGVCGAMASDPAATAVLVGLGVDELSVSVPAIAAVKAVLASLNYDACRALADRLLTLGSAAQVRDALGAEASAACAA